VIFTAEFLSLSNSFSQQSHLIAVTYLRVGVFLSDLQHVLVVFFSLIFITFLPTSSLYRLESCEV